MTLVGRQLAAQGTSLRGFGQVCNRRVPRPLTSRQVCRRIANARPCTDARLASDIPESPLTQQVHTEAILLRRYKAHEAAVTATLVLDDKGTTCLKSLSSVTLLLCVALSQPHVDVAGDKKEVVTASLDKSLALWRLQVLARLLEIKPVCAYLARLRSP